MKYEAKNYEHLLGLEGLSNELLKNHFTLYQGYINNTNKLIERLSELIKNGMSNSPDFSELKRRFGWEWNGMRMHEYYFGNMVKDGFELNKSSDLHKKITDNFGSYENFEQEFKHMGAMRGIGWVVLYYDSAEDKMFNTWINEHDAGHFAGASPILVMDVFEHAFMLDYGTKRDGYIESFFKAINWDEAVKRLENTL